jgi:hypothetical protein
MAIQADWHERDAPPRRPSCGGTGKVTQAGSQVE